QKACLVVEQVLQSTNYLVSERNEIVLNDYLDQPDVVASALIEHGLRLLKLQTNETTLEDYFLTLIGGNKNA
ncbi:ABC transporter ATP-binding protein, partial [Erysipelotrichaceae bacterium OttesenSCG-928-M19]|nr:ABC transporter ATP-binding protein [Erysipelotrichaceae bacterium OttesenSCG-928-M19]